MADVAEASEQSAISSDRNVVHHALQAPRQLVPHELQVALRAREPWKHHHRFNIKCRLGDELWALVDVEVRLWRRGRVVFLECAYLVLSFEGKSRSLACNLCLRIRFTNLLSAKPQTVRDT